MKIQYIWSWFEDNADDIESWFDSETFNWKEYSWLLTQNCSDKFDIWWDKDRFNQEGSSVTLTKYTCNPNNA